MRLTPDEIDADKIIEFLLENGAETGDLNISGDLDVEEGPVKDAARLELAPKDVRNISSPSEGWVAYHDGSGSHTEGPAHYDGTVWISTVDGSTIN